MNIVVFGAKNYDIEFLEKANSGVHKLTFLKPHLEPVSAALAKGNECVCLFVNDVVNAAVIAQLASYGVKLIALRCAGFNNVDLKACAQHNIKVVRVSAYSPYAVAEHTVGLILSLNRKIHRAYNRVKEGNFSLDGLMGFDIHGSTVGIIGVGKIGRVTAHILQGFGSNIIYHDLQPNAECDAAGMKYVSMDDLFAQSDIISLHCPLTPQTKHIINAESLAKMKQGVMLVNTSRGALIDTQAAIDSLKNNQIGHLALDVYEEEADLFFEDLSDHAIQDDVFARLLTFPNVLVTGHQAFFTQNALTNIALTTIQNITDFEQGKVLVNEVK